MPGKAKGSERRSEKEALGGKAPKPAVSRQPEEPRPGPLHCRPFPNGRVFKMGKRVLHHKSSGIVLPPPPEKALALLAEWTADESGYEEQTWPELQKALDEDRLSDRPLFRK